MGRERSRGRLSPARGRDQAAPPNAIGMEALFASALDGVSPTTFIGLNDTPSVYGTPGFSVVVNGTGSGLAFAAAGAGDMLQSVYDAAGIGGQLVNTDWAQVLSSKTLVSPVLTVQALLSTAGAAYTLTWDTPAGARAISIPDPLGTDEFVFAAMIQSLAGKTLVLPTIADFTNAIHDHTSDSEGGTLPGFTPLQQSAWLTGSSSGMQQVTAAYTTVPLTTVQEFTETTPTISSGAILPPEDGTYLIDASLGWIADTNNGADKVQVKWQVFNSVTGLWEDIPGH